VGDGGGPSSGIVFLRRMNSSSEGAQEPTVCNIDPPDLAAAVRDRLHVLDPDLTVRFAHRSFGGAFTLNPRDTPHEKEGSQ
jgi:hypothetical protein